jgi:HD superfamily phosphohydrolase YqeK
MSALVLRARHLLARLAGLWNGQRPAPPLTQLPAWARVGRKRRAHVRRVAALLEKWADVMGVSPIERSRWLAACWLHDALRDTALPAGLTHGEAAADRAARSGESDHEVLDAVRFHSVGSATWDDVGTMLHLADFLEPGRRARRKRRAQWAKRVPHDRDRVLREIVAYQIRSRLRRHKPVDPLTTEFWNSIVSLPPTQ